MGDKYDNSDAAQERDMDREIEDMLEEPTYRIIRFFRDPDKENIVVQEGLTLEEAQEHCNAEYSRGEGWFDGWTRET